MINLFINRNKKNVIFKINFENKKLSLKPYTSHFDVITSSLRLDGNWKLD